MIDENDATDDHEDGNRTERLNQSDVLTKDRRKAFQHALNKLQTLAGDACGGGSIS